MSLWQEWKPKAMYEVKFSPNALRGVAKLKKSEPISYRKLDRLIEELKVHPKSGTGKPKPLGGDRSGQWSRHITEKHRLVYLIDEEEISVVEVLSTWGHYDDK